MSLEVNFDEDAKPGLRIRMLETMDDPDPIMKKEEGTIGETDDIGQVTVYWDNGRTLPVIPGVDKYEILPASEDQITLDSFNESKKGPITTKYETSLRQALGKEKVKLKEKKNKSFKKKKEDDLEETTMAGGLGGARNYAYTPKLESKSIKVKDFINETTGVSAISSTIDFLVNNLIGWGTIEDMSPPWPSLTKKADNNQKEDWWWQKIPTYRGGVITDPYAKNDEVWDDDNLTVDIDKDITQFQKDVYKNPKKYKQSVITTDKSFDLNIDPKNNDWKMSLQKGVNLKNDHTTGDIQNFKNKNYSSSLKKEDITSFVDNLLFEVNKKEDKVHTKKWDRCVDAVKAKNKENKTDYNPYAVCQSSIGYEGSIKKSHRREEIEEEEGVNETTTFASVWGVNGPPSTPIFAAKKGQHRPSKKPLWKGGQIIQKVDSHGIFNESEKKNSLLDEINKVKWTKGSKYVKIKDKCAKYNNQPWCSQGAIDNPLELSDNTFENIKEISKKTGLSEDFILTKIIENLNKK